METGCGCILKSSIFAKSTNFRPLIPNFNDFTVLIIIFKYGSNYGHLAKGKL